MKPPVRRCAIYTRKSTEEGLDQAFNSLDAQREACAAYVTSQRHEGWEAIPESYDDGGFSGGTIDRPALKRLLGGVEARRIDVVVVYKVDRLTRSLADFARIVEIFERHQVSFVSVTQSFNTTSSMGRLTLNVLLSFAQFEREVTGERIRDKMAASRRKGMWMGGVAPLGYEAKDRKLVVNGRDAEHVRHIFRRYAELGCVSSLAVELYREGIRSKVWTTRKGERRGGSALGRGALYELLVNRTYLGLAVHKGAAYPGQHEAIVPQDLWDRVQHRLAANRRRVLGRPGQRGGALLVGLLFDDRGNPMSPTYTRKANGRRYRYYVSQVALKKGRKRAGTIRRVAAAAVENIVSSELRRRCAERTGDGLSRADPAEQAATVRAIVRRVELRADLVLIACDSSKIPDARGDSAQSSASSLVHVVARINRGKGHATVSEHATARIDRSLVKALVRAHGWRSAVEEARVRSTVEIAAREGCHVRYVRDLIKLAYLAPDLTEAILVGKQPPALALAALTGLPLAIDWTGQRAQMSQLR